MQEKTLSQEKRIAILIPCYNEEKTIADVITAYKSVLPSATIYVYDNNSKDNTGKIAKELGVVVVKEYRQGKGNVIKSMFRDIDADCYLMIDGDNTYPADKAEEMVNYVLNGEADMVIGDRLSSTYFVENKRRFHNFGNKLVRKLINKLFKNNINDIMTGCRAFSRAFVKNFPIISKGFEIETEMTIHAVDKNFLIKEIPIPYVDRPQGSNSKLNTIKDGTRVIKTIFKLFKDYYPLKFFGFIAMLLGLTAVGLFVPVLVDYIKTGLVSKFPTLIVSGVLATCGLLSFFTGLILDVVISKHKQLYENMLNHYFIDDYKRRNK